MLKNYNLSTITTLLLLIIGASLKAQIPNAGFENWHTAGFPPYNEPDNWGTLNSSTAIIGIYTVEKATGAGNYHNGTTSIKLSSHFISFAGQTAPGITATGTINTSTQAIDGGFAFAQRPTALTGWFKGTPAANDSASIEVTLSKWDATNHVRVTIGTATFYSSVTTANFTHFFAPITYTSGNTPDTALIIMSSSDTQNPVDGSVFYVDDLAFVDCSGFTASVTSTNATCTSSNGSATVTPSGGTNPYTFHWSNNGSNNAIFNLTAGSYRVTVTDANGCPVTATATVNANTTPITVSTSSTQSSCTINDGTATGTTTDGAQPYTYMWSSGANTSTADSLGAGSYTLTITDSNGCTGVGTATVTTPNGPTATSSSTDVLCHGEMTGSIDVVVTGGTSPITYLWSNSATAEDQTNILSGSYCLTIIDADGCSYQLCDTVNQPASAVSFTSVVSDATAQNAADGSIIVTAAGGTSPYSITWSTGDGTNLAAGSYCYTVTDANSCAISGCDTVSAPTGLRDVVFENSNVYPNPASEAIIIETATTNGKYVLSIFALDGKLVYEQIITAGKSIVSVTGIETGLYTYQLNNKTTGNMSSGKLQIQR